MEIELTEGMKLSHPRHGIVTLFETLGKLCLVKTSSGSIIGVRTSLLREAKAGEETPIIRLPIKTEDEDITKETLREKEIILKERYRTLSDLWDYKSKHKTHIRISKLMDETLIELRAVEDLQKIFK